MRTEAPILCCETHLQVAKLSGSLLRRQWVKSLTPRSRAAGMQAYATACRQGGRVDSNAFRAFLLKKGGESSIIISMNKAKGDMKTLILAMAATLGIALCGLVGCSKGGGSIDTSKVQSAFQSAPPMDKAEVQNAISELKAGNYPGALASLQKVATTANLTPEQKEAVQDLMGQVKNKGLGLGHKAMGGGGDETNQIGHGAGKAAENLQKPFK